MKKNYLLLVFFCSFISLPCLSQKAKERPEYTIGGALRFNYNYSDWNKGHRDRGGDFGYDVFLLRPQASYKGFMLDADFRFYSNAFGGFMLKYGWVGYRFSPENHLEVGLTRVPFGIQPSSANNFLLQISYYIGLEDDSDMGVKFVHSGEKWDYSLAFFKNADELLFGPDNETSDDRYGYDVAGRNKEINQLNGQVFFKAGDAVRHKIGVSAQGGQLYNLDTRDNGTHYALAAHYELYAKGLGIKAQASKYAKFPKNAQGEGRNLITMTAYGAPYVVAAKAYMYTLSIGYTFRTKARWLQSIQLYNDFGYLQKTHKDFEDSMQNVSGCLLTMGPIFTYIDYALGKHQAWLGPDWDAFGPGTGSNSWHARFNVNIGYYF